MSLLLEKKHRTPDAVDRLASVLEGLAVIVVAAPGAERPAQARPTCDCAAVPLTNGPEDDLANATWEDAEWQ
jgi:hypothetical protein